MRHDWDRLEGEALGISLAEATGWHDADDPDLGVGWYRTSGGQLVHWQTILTFETLTTVVWEQHLKPRGWESWSLFSWGRAAVAMPGRRGASFRADADTPEEALARAIGKALEAGE